MINFNEMVENVKALSEGMFDTQSFRDYAKTQGWSYTDDQLKELDSMLSTPDARPADFDGMLEAWLGRISLWGKHTIKHKNPDDGTNDNISDDEFLNYMDDGGNAAVYGKWKIKALALDKIQFGRTFWSVGKNKDVFEEIIVNIDLRQDLKNAIKRARKDAGLLGRFGF